QTIHGLDVEIEIRAHGGEAAVSGEGAAANGQQDRLALDAERRRRRRAALADQDRLCRAPRPLHGPRAPGAAGEHDPAAAVEDDRARGLIAAAEAERARARAAAAELEVRGAAGEHVERRLEAIAHAAARREDRFPEGLRARLRFHLSP